MRQPSYRAIGIMSGTSLDGIDFCVVDFKKTTDRWVFSLKQNSTVAYSSSWKERLATAHLLAPSKLNKLNLEYSHFLGEQIKQFCFDFSVSQVDLVASHGHTVFHQPEKKRTLQIGNLQPLYTVTGMPTICDFRLQDVLLGGQGAPLVPIGDELLFGQYAACVNIGGFANASVNQNGKRLAWDICPANIVLNKLCVHFNCAFDTSGNIARSGKQIPALFDALCKLPYYSKPLPKSLGREWVEKEIEPLLAKYHNKRDVMHTFTHHIAEQIATALAGVNGQVLLTGGGSYNTYLVELIQQKGCPVWVPETDLINQKEALIFAFLGVLRACHLPNCLRSVTGALYNHSSGRMYGDFTKFASDKHPSL